MPSKYALVIASSDYRDARLARLITPGQDARQLVTVLADPRIGRFDDVVPLINQSESTIRRAISRFVSQRRRDDLLLLYFSGHGILDEQGLLHFAAADTEPDALNATAIAAAFIRQELDRSSSRCQVLILDCCHSGAVGRGTKGVPGRSVGTAGAFQSPGTGRVTLTATDATQYAWEGDHVIGHAETSVFTYYLVHGLETGEADLDRDGRITLDELYDYVHDQVVTISSRQTPGKFAEGQHGHIVIADTPPADADPTVRLAAVAPLRTPAALPQRFDAYAMSMALDRIDPEERTQIEALAVLPTDTEVPGDVLGVLWSCAPDHVGSHRDRVVAIRALAGQVRASGDGLALMPAAHEVLARRLGTHAAALHESLVAQARPRSGDWLDLPAEAAYWWKHVIRHLKAADLGSECRDLLANLAFLRRRLQRAGAAVVLADYETLQAAEGRVLSHAVRFAADTAARDGDQLEEQLLARLRPGTSALVDDVIAQASRARSRPALRPLTCSLAADTGATALARHTGVVSSVAIISARRAASGSSDRTVRIWDLERGACVSVLEGHQQPVRAIAALRSDRLVSASADATLRIWDSETGGFIRRLEGHTTPLTTLTLMGPDVVSGTEGGTLRLWNVNTGATRVTFEGHTSAVTALATHDKPMLLASGTVDGAIRLWDTAAGETLAFLDGHTEPVEALMFTGPTQLISASWDATLRVWDLTRPGVSRVLPHGGPVRAMVVARQGLLLSAGADAVIRAWGLANYGCVREYTGHRDAVIAVVGLSHSTFVSGSTDRTVRVWSIESGLNLATFTFDAPVTTVTVLAGAGRLVVGDASGRVHVLQYEAGDLR